QGTTVEGSVPLPQPAGAEPAAPATAARPPARDDAAEVLRPLADQVRDAVREALEHYRGTARADAVRALGERLDAPPRSGVPGHGAAALVAALAAAGPNGPPDETAPNETALVETALDETALDADAFVVPMRRDPTGHVHLPERPFGSPWRRPAHAIGVLLVDAAADEHAQRLAAGCAADPDVRLLGHVVVPAPTALALAG